MYNEVLLILRVIYGWPGALKPHQTPVDELLADTQNTPELVALRLEEFCRATGANITPPYGFSGSGYEWVRYDYNKGGEYWEYYTRLELGMAVEPPVDQKAPAQSVSEWFSNIGINRTRLGLVLLDDNEYGRAELQRRREKAAFVPPEWGALGKSDHWRLAVMEGYIPAPITPFAAAYASEKPSLDSIRFLDAQQWLDNLRCDDKGKPRKWNDDGTLNPKFAGF